MSIQNTKVFTIASYNTITLDIWWLASDYGRQYMFQHFNGWSCFLYIIFGQNFESLWWQKDFSFDCVHHKFNKHTMWFILLARATFMSLYLHGDVGLGSNGYWLYLCKIWLHNNLFLHWHVALEGFTKTL
jgi:hypothetical protein